MSNSQDLELQLHGLEEQLMRTATRSSRKKLEDLLGEEFVEFGSNGVVYDRDSVISAMLLEEPVAWSISSFKALALADGIALVTYVATKRGGDSSLRCSVWKRTGARWRIVFHQGTRVQA